MVVTDTSTGTSISDIQWATGSTSAGWGTATSTSTGTAANFGISPRTAVNKKLQVPNVDDVPRRHKDKNGCVKKSYWEGEPFNITDIAGLSFNTADTGTGTFTWRTTDHTL